MSSNRNNGWNMVAYTNDKTQYGLTGVVHHVNGCKGRADGTWAGWHVEPGTDEELRKSPNKCGNCLRMLRIAI